MYKLIFTAKFQYLTHILHCRPGSKATRSTTAQKV